LSNALMTKGAAAVRYNKKDNTIYKNKMYIEYLTCYSIKVKIS